MFEVIQKHRRTVMFFIFAFIGIPLAFMVPGASDGRQSQGDGIVIVDVNGIEIYAHELLIPYNEKVQEYEKQNRPAEPGNLKADGVVDNILENLVQRAVLSQQTNQNAVIPNNDFIKAKIKDDPFFQNDAGEFVPAKYNQWVQGNDRGGIIWDDFYADYALGISQSSYLKLVQASARVSESEIREQYLKSQRKMKVRYITIEPSVELSEDALNKYLADNSKTYMTALETTVDYVRFSLLQPVPESVTAVLTQARAGDDFAALAKEHSVGADKEVGGDMGWVTVTETPLGLEKNYMGLAVGEVSDVIRSLSEFYLYKVEEERVNEETNVTEKHVRQIIFRPEVSPDALQAIKTAADVFLASVKAGDDEFRNLAMESKLAVITSPSFSGLSDEVEGVPTNDLRSFLQGFASLKSDDVSAVVTGAENIYVAKQIGSKDPVPQTLDQAREAVVRDATTAKKALPEYQTALTGYIDTIKTVKSLDDVAALFPDLTIEIKEPSKAFGPRDFLFNEGLFWNVGEVFQLLNNKEVGGILAPVVDFQGVNYVLELTEIVEPEAEAFEKDWAENKEAMVESVDARAKFARQTDYLKFMSAKAQSDGKVMMYKDLINETINFDLSILDAPADDESTEAEDDVTDPVGDAAPIDGATVAPAAEENAN